MAAAAPERHQDGGGGGTGVEARGGREGAWGVGKTSLALRMHGDRAGAMRGSLERRREGGGAAAARSSSTFVGALTRGEGEEGSGEERKAWACLNSQGVGWKVSLRRLGGAWSQGDVG